ncbi:MAG: hypothetical protein AB8G15_17450 [Saprospiraceae bacterium]
MKERKAKIFLFFLFVFGICNLWAQVPVRGVVSSIAESPIYLSVYWKNTHQLIRADKRGKFEFRLAGYEECLVAIYQQGTSPKVVSINTFVASKQKLQLRLKLTEKHQKDQLDFNTAPVQRLLATSSGQQNVTFELDGIEDKLNFSQLMMNLRKKKKKFYGQGIFPSERISYESNISAAELGKSEHRIGVEIYDLLQKKKALDQLLKKEESKAQEGQDCAQQSTLLKATTQRARIVSDLSFKRLDREKLRFRRRQAAAKTVSSQAIVVAQKNAETNRRHYEIATLKLRNQQIDCWEERLQKSLTQDQRGGKSLAATELVLRQLELSDVRYQRRIENAIQLYEQHQALSKTFTGRDRVVELAKSQKHIADQEQLRFQQKENAVKRWELKAKTQPQLSSQVAIALKAKARQREIAYQAEMAYLEHMWHLRDQPGMQDTADELYQQSSGIETIAAFRSSPEEQQVADLERFKNSLDQKIKLTSTTDTRGAVKQVRFEEDAYEIVVDEKGRKRYFKNNKPITKLTYAFETKRLFGAILKNIRYEESSKAGLFDFFRQKLD